MILLLSFVSFFLFSSVVGLDDVPTLFNVDTETPAYMAKDGKGSYIARIDAVVQFSVPYMANSTKGKGEKMTATFALPLANLTSIVGKFPDNSTLSMEVTWPNDAGNESEQATWFLIFTNKSDVITLTQSRLIVPISEEFNFSKTAIGYGNTTKDIVWSANLVLNKAKGQFYQCHSGGKLTNENGTQIWNGTTKIEAFTVDRKTGAFSKDANECPADPTPPAPPVQQGNWTFGPCLHMVGDITLHLSYPVVNKTDQKVSIMLPANATVDKKGSSCSDMAWGPNVTMQRLTLVWNKTNSVVFWISENKTFTGADNVYAIVNVEVQLDATNKTKFPNFSNKTFKTGNDMLPNGTNALHWLNTAQNKSYKCNSVQHEKVNDIFMIETKNFKFQAFANETKFRDEVACAADHTPKTSDLIPIIVGACLAGLVVIVLVVYLIGRARARRAGGYESV